MNMLVDKETLPITTVRVWFAGELVGVVRLPVATEAEAVTEMYRNLRFDVEKIEKPEIEIAR